MDQGFYLGKTAIVTGGSEGIGLALAEDLAALGTHVILCSRTKEKLQKAVNRLEARRTRPQQTFDWASVDVADSLSARTSMESLVEKHGVPDFLFNCAGYALPGYLHEQEMEALRGMMEVNYFGTVHTTKALVPYFMKKKQGHIINVSSMAGFLGLFGYTGYCASKYAVIGFSQALRQELKPFGIRVSVLCPPNTRTPGLERENQFKPKDVLQLEEKAKVVEAAEVSKSLLKALPQGKFMIIPTVDGSVAYRLSRYLPWVIDYFTKRPVPGAT